MSAYQECESSSFQLISFFFFFFIFKNFSGTKILALYLFFSAHTMYVAFLPQFHAVFHIFVCFPLFLKWPLTPLAYTTVYTWQGHCTKKTVHTSSLWDFDGWMQIMWFSFHSCYLQLSKHKLILVCWIIMWLFWP